MSLLEFLLMSLFTVIGIKYLIDMIKYSLGYEINGKCRYGRKYARQLAKGKRSPQIKKEIVLHKSSEVEIHNDVTKLIAQLGVN